MATSYSQSYYGHIPRPIISDISLLLSLFSFIHSSSPQVHARAFKLLSKLSGVILLDGSMSRLMYRLYLEYDPEGSGSSLTLVSLAK